MKKPLILYHANCLDGFGAAFAAFEKFREGDGCLCDFVPAAYGDDPPDFEDRNVYLLDFSYRRAELNLLCEKAKSVTIIDHHITAKNDLSGLDKEHDNLEIVFDMEKSGAMLAWEYFNSLEAPKLFSYIQDRDIWRFEFKETNDVYAALMARPFDFLSWAALIRSEEKLKSIIKEGKAINRYRNRMIEAYKKRSVIAEIAGYRVPVVNCPGVIASDLLGELAKGQPFAAGYQDIGTKRSWSLRSTNEGEDVAKIAEKLGGGGHRNAAGFSMMLDESVLSVSLPRS